MGPSDPFRPKRLGVVDCEAKLWLFSSLVLLVPFLSFPPGSPLSRKLPALLSYRACLVKYRQRFGYSLQMHVGSAQPLLRRDVLCLMAVVNCSRFLSKWPHLPNVVWISQETLDISDSLISFSRVS